MLPRVAVPALALTVGLGAGLLAAPSSAEALSCIQYHAETIELELVAAELDGSALDIGALAGVPATWLATIRSGSEAGEEISVSNDDDSSSYRWARLDLDMPITPTDAVADHLADSEDRRSRGVLCGDVPYIPVYPGVYVFRGEIEDEHWPWGGTLTLDGARETVVVEFPQVAGNYVLTYEVVDFYFPGDDGCSVADSSNTGPGGLAMGLALLALCGWRRRLV